MPVPVPAVIPGDVVGMRDLAQSLKNQAGRLGGVQNDVLGARRAMTFEGPAGDRFGHRMRTVASNLGNVVNGLTETAGMIARAADDVEASQRAHDAAVA